MSGDHLRASLAYGTSATRIVVQPPRPAIVVNVCHWCGAMWATYAGSLPRGWRKAKDWTLTCRRCRP